MAAETLRKLANPECRKPVRADFPDILQRPWKPQDFKAVLETVEQELAKLGLRLDDIHRINIAYPHKHPEKKKEHFNTATAVALHLQQHMREHAPGVEWVMADAIYEEKHLDRSSDQSALHALIGRQHYEIDPSIQKETLPFIMDGNETKEFFLIVDATVEQGTTIANLYNFIEHNGGHVLGVVANTSVGKQRLQQIDCSSPDAKAPFNEAARNTGRISQLAEIFAESANLSLSAPEEHQAQLIERQRMQSMSFFASAMAGDLQQETSYETAEAAPVTERLSPARCVEMFEEALNLHGNSLYALTDGECKKLVSTMSGNDYKEQKGFHEMVAALKANAVPKAA